MTLLLQLFWEYFQIGLFAVGGGMATMPFLYKLADKYAWFTYEELTNMLAVSESTPGPIGVNMATYVGFKMSGIPGALMATAGLVLPSLLVILIVAMFLRQFRTNKYVNAAFYALRPASAALIAAAGIGVIRVCLIHTDLYAATGSLLDLIDLRSLALGIVLYVLTNYVKPLKKLHPVAFIAFAALVGIVFRLGGV